MRPMVGPSRRNSVAHPIAGDELRAIKRYLATREGYLHPAVSVRTLVTTHPPSRQLYRQARSGWPHMRRHSCGYYLADRGTDLRTMQDYLGDRNPKHTAYSIRVAGRRFEGLWR